MLLPRTRSVHTIGMRFPLDVAFLDRTCGGRVVTPAGRPWRVALPRRGARTCSKPGRSFERWGCSVGDRLEIRETS